MKYLIPLLLASSQAFAIPAFNGVTSGELKWNGSIDAACNLATFVDGTVVANSSQTELNSKLSGGSAATADIFANANGFHAVIGNPILVGPSGQVSDAVIVIEAAATGSALDGSALSPIQANPQGIMTMAQGGMYQLTANAKATRQAGGAFDAGAYVVKVPVSCSKGIGPR